MALIDGLRRQYGKHVVAEMGTGLLLLVADQFIPAKQVNAMR